jgi:hypothetical protein
MSWYHLGNGFFINTALLMFSLLVNAWLLLLIGVTGLGRDAVMREQLAYLGLVQIFQLSSLSLLVYILTVWCEQGLLAAFTNVAKQAFAGSMLFYVFRAKTSAFSFTNDLKFGGAEYAATGRGYKLKATDFVVLFQQYARSHVWFGGHLLLLLVVALVIGVPVSPWALWSSWLVVLSLLVAPFWFNPFSFDWASNKNQAGVWWEWMWELRRAGRSKNRLWYEWNEDQLAGLVDMDEKQLGRFWSALWGLFWNLPVAVLVSFAVVSMFGHDRWYLGLAVVVGTNAVAAVLLPVSRVIDRLSLIKDASAKVRITGLLFKVILVGAACAAVGVSASGIYRELPAIVAKLVLIEFELIRLFSTTLLALFPKQPRIRRCVNAFCWVADMALGLLMLLLLFAGSLFGILTKYQATVLFSAGYAAAYLMEKALKGTEVDRITQEIKVLQQNSRQTRAADQDYLDRNNSSSSADSSKRNPVKYPRYLISQWEYSNRSEALRRGPVKADRPPAVGSAVGVESPHLDVLREGEVGVFAAEPIDSDGSSETPLESTRRSILTSQFTGLGLARRMGPREGGVGRGAQVSGQDGAGSSTQETAAAAGGQSWDTGSRRLESPHGSLRRRHLSENLSGDSI